MSLTLLTRSMSGAPNWGRFHFGVVCDKGLIAMLHYFSASP